MDLKNISALRNQTVQNLSAPATYGDGFHTLVTLAAEVGTTAQLDAARKLRVRYNAIVRQVLAGVISSAEYDTLREQYKWEGRQLADEMTHRLLTEEMNTMYASQTRFWERRSQDTLLSATVEYLDEASRLRTDPMALISATSGKTIETLASDIFSHLWTDFPLQADQAEALLSLLGDESVAMYDRVLWVNGMFLGAMEFFDPVRMTTLLKIYDLGIPTLSMAALTGFLLAQYRFNRVTGHPDITAQAKLSAQRPDFSRDMAIALSEILRGMDLKRTNEIVTHEIIPTLASLSGMLNGGELSVEKLAEKFGSGSSRAADALRRLQEMQMEGEDTDYVILANARGGEFFRHVDHWFAGFNAQDSYFAPMAEKASASLLEMMGKMTFLPASDRYAMLSMLMSAPDSMRQGMQMQWEQQYNTLYDAFEQQKKSIESPDMKAKIAAGHFVKGYMRFLGFFRRKSEFFNPFEKNYRVPVQGYLKVEMLTDEDRYALMEFASLRRQDAAVFDLSKKTDKEWPMGVELSLARHMLSVKRAEMASDLLTEAHYHIGGSTSRDTIKEMVSIALSLPDPQFAYDLLKNLQSDEDPADYLSGLLDVARGFAASGEGGRVGDVIAEYYYLGGKADGVYYSLLLESALLRDDSEEVKRVLNDLLAVYMDSESVKAILPYALLAVHKDVPRAMEMLAEACNTAHTDWEEYLPGVKHNLERYNVQASDAVTGALNAYRIDRNYFE